MPLRRTMSCLGVALGTHFGFIQLPDCINYFAYRMSGGIVPGDGGGITRSSRYRWFRLSPSRDAGVSDGAKRLKRFFGSGGSGSSWGILVRFFLKSATWMFK